MKYLHKLGTPSLPLPTMTGLQLTDTGNIVEGTFAAITDPVLLKSDVPFQKVIGDVLRNLPVPSLQPDFFRFLRLLHANQRRIVYLEGQVGLGKSHNGLLLGRMISPEGALVFNCQNYDVRDAFAQTVINQDALRPVTEKIDNRIAEHNSSQRKMGPLSLDALRALGGDTITESNGQISIDWKKISGLARAPEPLSQEQDQALAKAREEKDEGEIQRLSNEYQKQYDENNAKKLTGNIEKIQTFCAVEGIPFGAQSAGGGQLGLKVIPGPLTQGFLTGRPVLLDEVPRARAGTPDCLLELGQFSIGERDSFTITVGDQILTFDRKQMGEGFAVVMTGNRPEDDPQSHPLSDALLDRVDKIEVHKPTQYDLQHYWSTLLTGLPIATIAQTYSNMVKSDPREFGDFLFKIRIEGLEPDAIAQIPAWQLEELGNWQNIIKASAKLAAFQFQASQLCDTESEIYTKDTTLSGVLNEIQGVNMSSFDMGMRFARRRLQDAISGRDTNVLPSQLAAVIDWRKGLAGGDSIEAPVEPANPAETLGTGIAQAYIDSIARKTAQMPLLREQWLTLAKQNDIYTLPDPTTADPKSLIALLNCDPDGKLVLTEEAVQVQKAICALMRARDAGLSDKDDEVLPLPRVQKAMDEAARLPDGVEKVRRFIVPSPFDDIVEVRKRPLVTYDIADTLDESAPQVSLAAIPMDHVIAGLTALPPYIQHNWHQILQQPDAEGSASDTMGGLFSQYKNLLTGRAPSGVAFTTVAVVSGLSGAEQRSLHILAVDKGADGPQFLMAGGFESASQNPPARITWVHGSAEDCDKQISEWLVRQSQNSDPAALEETRKMLIHAMRERKREKAEGDSAEDSLGAELYKPQPACYGNVFATPSHG